MGAQRGKGGAGQPPGAMPLSPTSPGTQVSIPADFIGILELKASIAGPSDPHIGIGELIRAEIIALPYLVTVNLYKLFFFPITQRNSYLLKHSK